VRKASSKLFVVAALGLIPPFAAYQHSAASAEACPFARARAEAAGFEVPSETLPGGPSLFGAARGSPAIFP
jgi:hypothetical protein